MIYVSLMGGLGNQLFQYATGMAQALRLGTDLKVYFEDHYEYADRKYALYPYLNDDLLVESKNVSDLLPAKGIKRKLRSFLGLEMEKNVFRERTHYAYDDSIDAINDNTLLIGFWQSYRYFEGIEVVLKRQILIKDETPIYQLALDYLQKLERTVSIHVRRRDYLVSNSGFQSLPLDYYRKADEYLTGRISNYTPVVFSDDYCWARENLSFLKHPIFAEELRLLDFEELSLMSHCSHHVIANSSFSWWGAWLDIKADKIIIAPSAWHSAVNSESDLIPNTWIKI